MCDYKVLGREKENLYTHKIIKVCTQFYEINIDIPCKRLPGDMFSCTCQFFNPPTVLTEYFNDDTAVQGGEE